MLRRDFWRTKTPFERLDFYTRWSLYISQCIPGVVIAVQFIVAASRGALAVWVAAVALALIVVWTVLMIRVLAATLNTHVYDAPFPTRHVFIMVVTAVALGVVIFASMSAAAEAWNAYPSAIFMLFIGVGLSLAPALSWRRVIYGALIITGIEVLVLITYEPGQDDLSFEITVGLLFALAFMVSWRISAWTISNARESERRKELSARLAVAEERLRFSRDLHDTVGRALSAIAVKSQLAAEQLRRGLEGAESEITEIHQLAEATVGEMRDVVAGYRTAELSQELAGARSILHSAGATTHVVGDDISLPPDVAEALAWAVREATTNVVRHSTASRCNIAVSADDDHATLTVTNNGIRSQAGPRSGLQGLQQRLKPVDGTVDTIVEGELFTLTVTVPLNRPGAPTSPSGQGEVRQ